MLVVGITGLAGSGKSTAAERLISRHGFERGKFANALKEMLRTLLRYRGADEATIERMIEGDLKEVPSPLLNGRSPRHAMKTLGTEWGRDEINEDLWVDTETASVLRRKPEKIVFDDVRFPNEVAAIRRLGGQIWRVSRSIEDYARAKKGAAAAASHPSEALGAVPDRQLGNYGGKAELAAVVDMQIAAMARAAERAAARAA
ncbi:hypothetical protein PMNALOAF_2737 [Methylobacterium adhaesivum]|uniref:Deoxynucleotide monophosphate kinase n=1 Tax=Methylobacterium adhaesivum TaxID=333297 RepID=A0ABT8BLM4_9HYPH|nr:deoxynucleotide monophosphate kinase [Methylobacterium adhaesivum]MDN3592091.1 deoxynucleotide monophosphate kinase [Methylobacterium adhaesivum]GJD31478.1 hypothetical protein PMNALOAF_2737 [Methylobacterium adhaesivum]